MASTHNWCKQIFLSQIPIYPLASLIINGFRSDTYWTSFYIDRVKYELSEENLELFEQELVKVNDTMEIPFEDIKITISPTYKLSDQVYGITGFRYGADYVFPVRTLVKTVPEFREHLAKIAEGATGFKFNTGAEKVISDKDIEEILLSDTAKSFLFRRAVIKSTAYQMFSMKYGIWGAIVGCYYFVYIFLSKLIGPIIPLAITIPITIGTFYFVNRAYTGTQEVEFDRKIYTIDRTYAEGCKEFLTSCIKFGLLMNKLVKPERGRAFTADGNPTNGQVAYTTRLELVNAHLAKLEYANKAKKLRQLEEK